MGQKNHRFPLTGILYIVIIFCLFLYSFTQVDLSLTLSRVSIFQTVEKSFQHIGYFNRSLSTYLFITLLMFLHFFYVILLCLVHQKKIGRKHVWMIILVTAVFLGVSYNAFSYDLFNYIFDAKIVTHYQQNPYLQKALDYPQDPMLSFMHWTHRTYPYGLVWLVLTVPFSFLGLNHFLLTFFLFKALAVFCFLAAVYFIEKTVELFDSEHSLLSVSLFAFNPLVLIETLVSAHNDSTMFFLAVLGVYFLFNKNVVKSYISLAFSIGIKFATVFLVPAFFLKTILFKNNNLSVFEAFNYLVILSMVPAFVLVVNRTNFQPWYLLYIVVFLSYMSKRIVYVSAAVGLSIVGLLAYIPFLYTGSWNDPTMKFFNPVVSIGISIILVTLIVDCCYKLFLFGIKKKTT